MAMRLLRLGRVAWACVLAAALTVAPLGGLVTQRALASSGGGTVVAWGHNSSGQTGVPVGLSGVTAIAAGYEFSLALKNDGTVVAWGWDLGGQTDVPAGLSGVTAISAGSDFSLALCGSSAGGSSAGEFPWHMALVLGGIVLVVLLLVALAFFLRSRSRRPKAPPPPTQRSQQPAPPFEQLGPDASIPGPAAPPTSASSPAVPVAAAVSVAPATPAVPPPPPAWAPTHAVPAGGMSAWDSPNPSLAQVISLAESTELAVIGRSGDWAQVRAVNGWSGWVDARLLVAKQ
jgi:hypothetical protein